MKIDNAKSFLKRSFADLCYCRNAKIRPYNMIVLKSMVIVYAQ